MTTKLLTTLVLGICLVATHSAIAQEKKPAPPPAAAKIVYVPPARGAPKSRVGGGTRGVDPNAIIVRLLAPEEMGIAGTDQPVLYWFLSQPTDAPVEITLIDDTSIEPVFEITTNSRDRGGIRALKLADHGVHLKPNVEYQWSVAIVVDTEQRSRDVFSSGVIMYQPPDTALRSSVGAASPGDIPSVYASAGYWYDAIDSLSGLINSSVDNSIFVAQRAALLEQVGLVDVITAGTR
jgi:hypothetical protein